MDIAAGRGNTNADIRLYLTQNAQRRHLRTSALAGIALISTCSTFAC